MIVKRLLLADIALLPLFSALAMGDNYNRRDRLDFSQKWLHRSTLADPSWIFERMMRHVSIIAFAVIKMFCTSSAFAEDFAPFYTAPDVPKALVLNGDIDPRTPLAFKRALDANPQIDVLILNSPGGSVQAALLVAEEVHDRKLITFVPPSGTCASACAFIFFAGEGRLAAGRLGVHQIYGGNDIESTQLNLSDIIETLTKYGVSPAVITKMLRTPPSSMHYFSKEELVTLGIQSDSVPSPDVASKPVALPKNAPLTQSDADQEAPAKKAVLDLIASGSLGPDQVISKASSSYSGSVQFYGRTLSKDDVLRDKLRYVERWPMRNVVPRDASIEVACENDTCSVSGLYDWSVANPQKKKQISGVSKFFYRLQMSIPPLVTEENGIVIDRTR